MQRSWAAQCNPARGVFPGWHGEWGAPSCSHGWEPWEAPALIPANCLLAGNGSAWAAEEKSPSKVSSTRKKKKIPQYQGHPNMKFLFTGQQQSLLDHPPPLLTSHVSQAIKGLVKAWCSGSGFSAACIFRSLCTGDCCGRDGNAIRSCTKCIREYCQGSQFFLHLLQLCEQNHNLYTWKKPDTKLTVIK